VDLPLLELELQLEVEKEMQPLSGHRLAYPALLVLELERVMPLAYLARPRPPRQGVYDQVLLLPQP
jgi:hypothetical protein